MAERNDPELNIRVTLLLSQIESRIPEHLRTRRQSPGKKVATPVSCDPFLISKGQIPVAERMLRQLTDRLAVSADCQAGWREKSAVEMLQAWGWSAEVNENGSLKIDWVNGEAVALAGFAVLAALAPLCSNGQIVFAVPLDKDVEHFGVRVSGGKIEVRGAQKRVSFVLD